MSAAFQRQITFEGIYNCRDLGGYRTRDNRSVIERKLFRSGKLNDATARDIDVLKKEIGLRSILDLRSSLEINSGDAGLIGEAGFNFFNVSLIDDGGETEANIRRYEGLATMGEFYAHLVKQDDFAAKMIEILQVLADPSNYPLVFNCSAGKDRTGMVAAIVLDILGVSDNDIAEDYVLTALHPLEPYNHPPAEVVAEGKRYGLPEYFWNVTHELMTYFLDQSRNEYGSFERYISIHGGDTALITAVKENLLR